MEFIEYPCKKAKPDKMNKKISTKHWQSSGLIFFYYKTDAHVNTAAKHRCLASVLTQHIIGTMHARYLPSTGRWTDVDRIRLSMDLY